MKPQISNRTVTSTLQGERTMMTVDMSSMGHIMSILTNLYNDKEMAVVREYGTNGYDANLEVGYTGPLEVELPTHLNPSLVIRDHGPGLDWDDIVQIYSQYGASTKRNSNDFNGMFGLGCKSALTYTDQFTIKAIKHGTLTIVAVSRDEDGSGGMTKVHEGPTTEGNGVEITIPTQRYNDFASKARKLFQWWPKGSVTVDGQLPQTFGETTTALEVVPGIFVQTRSGYGSTSYVIMGNVPYPVSHTELGLPEDVTVHAYVPGGSVEPLPSREALQMTSETKKTLLGVGETIKRDMAKKIRQEIGACSTHWEAVACAAKIKNTTPKAFHPSTWTYRGEEIPAGLDLAITKIDAGRDKWGYTRKKNRGGWCKVSLNGSGKDCSYQEHLKIDDTTHALFFYGFDVDFTRNHRRRLEIWINNKGLNSPIRNFHKVYLTQAKVDSKWLPPHWYNWEDVRSTPLPANAHGYGGKLLGSYEGIIPGSVHAYEVLASAIDTSLPIYYFIELASSGRHEQTRAQKAMKWVKEVRKDGDCTVLLIPDTRLAKLLRQFPNAKNIKEVVKEKFAKWEAGLTEAEKLALTLRNEGASAYKHLDPQQILDPDIQATITALDVKIDSHFNTYATYSQTFGFYAKLPEWEDPLQHYPLVSAYNLTNNHRDHINHITLYLNAAYREFRQGGKVNI